MRLCVCSAVDWTTHRSSAGEFCGCQLRTPKEQYLSVNLSGTRTARDYDASGKRWRPLAVLTRRWGKAIHLTVDRVAESGERLAAATVVWCAGMRASRLTEQLPVARDRLGRLQVDDYLRVIGVPAMFAAGDVAAARMDDEHLSVMSCQHGRPMGRYAGCNVINDLFDQPLLALRIPWYVTVLDLGSAGAVYTEGWERKVVSQGAPAKTTKQSINTRRIYPPLNGSRADLLAAAAPRVQPRP